MSIVQSLFIFGMRRKGVILKGFLGRIRLAAKRAFERLKVNGFVREQLIVLREGPVTLVALMFVCVDSLFPRNATLFLLIPL